MLFLTNFVVSERSLNLRYFLELCMHITWLHIAIKCYIYISSGNMLLSSVMYIYHLVTYSYHVLCVYTTQLYTAIRCYVYIPHSYPLICMHTTQLHTAIRCYVCIPHGYMLLSNIMYTYQKLPTAVECYVYIPPCYLLLSSVMCAYHLVTYFYQVIYIFFIKNVLVYSR